VSGWPAGTDHHDRDDIIMITLIIAITLTGLIHEHQDGHNRMA
jgi:hypothetical protein